MYLLRTVLLFDEQIQGQLTVVADVNVAPGGAGLVVGPIRGYLDGVEVPLDAWERVVARTALERGYLELLGVTWEDRAA